MNSSALESFNKFHENTHCKHHNLIWAVPGLVFGFNYSILDALEEYRKQFQHEKAYLYFHTWKTSFNLPFVKKLESLTDPKTGIYKNIELKYTISTYEKSELLEIAHRLMKDLGITSKQGLELHFDHSNFKRLVYFYSHYLTYKLIYNETSRTSFEAFSTPLVFRLSPKIQMADFKWINSKGFETFVKIFEYPHKHLSPESLEKVEHPYDILYTTDSGTSYYDDMFYASSPKTLVNIFGTNIEEFYQKFLSLYTKYLYRYPGSLVTDDDLTSYARTKDMLPIEGSTILKHFADHSKHEVINCSNRHMGAMMKSVMPIRTPWYYIIGDNIYAPKEIEGDKLLTGFLNINEENKMSLITKRML